MTRLTHFPYRMRQRPDLSSGLFLWSFRRLAQEFHGIDLQDIRELSHDFQACVVGRALFKSAEIGAIQVGLVSQTLLRQPFLMPQTAEIDGECLAQIHGADTAAGSILTNGVYYT